MLASVTLPVSNSVGDKIMSSSSTGESSLKSATDAAVKDTSDLISNVGCGTTSSSVSFTPTIRYMSIDGNSTNKNIQLDLDILFKASCSPNNQQQKDCLTCTDLLKMTDCLMKQKQIFSEAYLNRGAPSCDNKAYPQTRTILESDKAGPNASATTCPVIFVSDVTLVETSPCDQFPGKICPAPSSIDDSNYIPPPPPPPPPFPLTLVLIVVGSLVAATLLFLLVWWCRRHVRVGSAGFTDFNKIKTEDGPKRRNRGFTLQGLDAGDIADFGERLMENDQSVIQDQEMNVATASIPMKGEMAPNGVAASSYTAPPSASTAVDHGDEQQPSSLLQSTSMITKNSEQDEASLLESTLGMKQTGDANNNPSTKKKRRKSMIVNNNSKKRDVGPTLHEEESSFQLPPVSVGAAAAQTSTNDKNNNEQKLKLDDSGDFFKPATDGNHETANGGTEQEFDEDDYFKDLAKPSGNNNKNKNKFEDV